MAIWELKWEWLLAEILGLAGALLVVFLLIRLIREHRSPTSTMAWGIAILLLPYVGVPLYLLFGGRKVRRHRRLKGQLFPVSDTRGDADLPAPAARPEIVETVRVLEGAGYPAVKADNHLEFIASGEKAYARLMEMVAAAKVDIAVTVFILGHHHVGRSFVELLTKKAREGVKVRLLLDAVGSFRTRWGFVAPLRQAGGRVGVFMPILPIGRKWSTHLRTHRKLVAVDGRTAMIGGMNISHEYMGPTPDPKRWTDACAIVSGPVVDDLLGIFAVDWHFATGEDWEPSPPDWSAAPRPGDTLMQVVASGPDADAMPLHDAVLISMLRAKRRVWIVSPYFIPDDSLLRTLMLLGRMGRDVRLIVPSRSNHFIADLARGAFFRDLMGSSVKLFAYRKGMLHTKLLVIDDEIAMVGSANMDIRSLYLDYELGVLVYSAKEVQVIADVIRDYQQDADRLTWEKGIRKNFALEMAEDVCRLFAPIL